MIDFKLTNKEIKDLIYAGSLAPSGGNMQPWKVVVVNNNSIQLMLKEDRASSFLDIDDMASYLALGSFAKNILVVANSKGLKYKVLDFSIQFTGRKKPKYKEPLLGAISKRVTNRKKHGGGKIDEKLVQKLKQSIRSSNKHFLLMTVHSESEKKTVSDILGTADGIRTYHKELFKQMMKEIRWTGKEVKETRDGLDIETLELPGMVKQMLKLINAHPAILQKFPKQASENQAKPLIMASSHLCCLTMKKSPTPESMFEAGMVLQTLWLTATKHRLALHPWTVLPFFLMRLKYYSGKGFDLHEKQALAKLDNNLRSAFSISKTQDPFFIFRLSIAKPPSARSLRLPWKQFTSIK